MLVAAAPELVRVLFWLLAAAVVVAPRRWSLLAYLLIIQVDVSGPGWASHSAVGLENAIKVGLLPLVLLVRAGFAPLTTRWGRPMQFWLLLTGYAALAGLWSPYPLSAVKLVVYLAGYALVFLVLSDAWQRGLLDIELVAVALWLALLLAAVQTFLLGNPFGVPPKIIVEPARFTSFAPPQFFAAYLAASGALLLLRNDAAASRRWRAFVLVSAAAAGVALIFAASRYVLLGVAAMLAVALLARLLARSGERRRGVSARPLLLAALVLAAVVGTTAWLKPDNRVFQLGELVHHGRLNTHAIGTFRWRLEAYHTALDDIKRRGPLELAFGSGTSSGARVILEFDSTGFPEATLDPNRAIHDEFIRALYEWGILGLLLFLGFCAALLRSLLALTRAAGMEPLLVFWAFLPTLLLALALENVLAGSGTPVGTGIVLVLSYAYTNGHAYVTAAAQRSVLGQESSHAPALRSQPLPTARG